MERTDRIKTVHHRKWVGNYNTWRKEMLDASTTELSGTFEEVGLNVSGLKALKGQILLNQATGVEHGYPSNAPKLEDVDRLLASIEEPNYVNEPIVERI